MKNHTLHRVWMRALPDDTRLPTPSGTAEDYARMNHRIYQDQRAINGTRELLLALAYATTIADIPPGTEWELVEKILTGGDQSKLKELVRRDSPRYEIPDQHIIRGGSCEAKRMRPYIPRGPILRADDLRRNTDRVCGATARICVLERDLITGQHIHHWYCARHRDEAERVREQLAPGNDAAPEPVPNRGGLMPAYFDCPWLDIYRWACGATWQPPVYGLSADEWPDPQNPPKIHRKRLRLIET